MTVVSLSDARKQREPHNEGAARCMACRHEWVAVAPAGQEDLECPSCGRMFGRFLYPFSPDTARWVCACDNDLFIVTPAGTFCPACGTWQSFE